MKTCKDCVKKNCVDRLKNKGCEGKVKYEDTPKFDIYNRMMRDNKGVDGPM